MAKRANIQPVMPRSSTKPAKPPVPKPAANTPAPTLPELTRKLRNARQTRSDKIRALADQAAALATTATERADVQRVLHDLALQRGREQRWVDAEACYAAAIDVHRDGDDTELTADLLAERGVAFVRLGNLEQAETWIRRAATMHEAAKREAPCARALGYLSGVCFERGQLDRAVELAREAVDRAVAANDLHGAAHHAYGLVRGLNEQGRSREAGTMLETALEWARRFHVPELEGNFETLLGNAALSRCELASARSHYDRALAVFTRLGLAEHVAITLSNLGNLAWDDDRLEDALELYAQSLASSPRQTRSVAITQTGRAGVLVELGRFDEAERELASALGTLVQLGHERRGGFVRAGFARLAEARGEHADARAHYAEAEMMFEAAGDTVEIGRMLFAAAGVEAAIGDAESAAALIARAEDLTVPSLPPDPSGDPREGAVRALRELALGRVELARSLRVEGNTRAALRASASARLLAVTAGSSSLVHASSEVRRVAALLETQLGAS